MDSNPSSRTRWRVRRSGWLSRREAPGQTVEGISVRHLTRGFTEAAALLGLSATLVGVGHLAAWLGGYLTQRGLSTITMKANAALCLTLVSAALVLLVVPRAGPIRRWTARTCAVLALVVGLLTFVENLSGWDFGIDELLAAEMPGAIAVASPNRMGTPASFSFTLIGSALLILSRRDRRGAWVMQALALAVCLIAILSTIGFLYGAREFYGIVRYTGIAWPTAVSLLLLGLGLLAARPAEGLMAQITANDPGGVSLRRLLPPFVLLPLLLGWLRLTGERAGVFDAATGTAMMMLLFIVLFSALAYHAGRRASRSTQALRHSERRYRSYVEVTNQWAWVTDAGGRVREDIPALRRFTGQTYEQARGAGWAEALHPDDVTHTLDIWNRAVAARTPYETEYRMRRHDGVYRVLLARGVPIFDEQGQVLEWVGTCMDVTERKRAEETMRWSARRDEVLSQTAARLLQSDHPQSLVEELCRQVMEFLDCQVFFNFLVDQQPGRLHLNAGTGIPEEEARRIEWLDYGVAVCGCVARDGVRVIAEDISNTPDPRTTLVKSYGIQAYCCHPLKVQDRLIGTLSFGTRSRPRFHPEEIEVMKTVADLVAMAMHRIEIEKALRELNATLESRVVQRTAELAQRARQLQKLTLELTQAEERERRRIAVILHEDLQQQIAGAKFHLSLLKGRARDNGQRGQVEAVEEMLKDAIEKSRSLSHDLSPAVVRMNDLDEVLRWLAHRVRTQHGLVVHVEVRGDALLHSEALALFLFRATQELLFNVVKHAHIRQAAIQVRRVGRYVCLSVSDQGRGFDPQGLKETPGIGLFSIRERTELLGGRLTVKSVAGQGSTVRIVVPDGKEEEKVRRSEGRKVSAEEDKTVRPSDLPTFLPSSGGGPLRVLLVDDHDIVREGLAAALKEAPGIELVGEACDGREAINVALDLQPDVVLMDVSMPLMGGDQATRQIKTYRPETRVIALSMYDEADKKERMFEAGAERYILKTVSTDELLAAIREKSADGS